MKCEKCGAELVEFNDDYFFCDSDNCPTLSDGWDRLIRKEE